MIGEIWWKRTINAVRFLDDVQYFLESDKSVVLNFPNDVPWLDIMTEELSQNIAKKSDIINFEVLEGNNISNVGKYLYERFSGEGYWPTTHKSYERFMSSNTATPLNNCVVCAVGVNSVSAAAWVKSVKEYHETCTMEKHGLFVIVTKGANVRSSEHIECLEFSDYITDYDCMMLCLMIISSIRCSRIQKLYLAEVASNIADNNIENAALLISAGVELIQNPIEVARQIFEENDIKCTRLEEKVNTGVWEAQIRLVFPRIEHFRSKFVQKYESKLKKHLPITNNLNERIDKVSDIEIGQLYVLCTRYKFVEQSDYDSLKKMKDARNSLAHRNAIPYNKLMELQIF